MIDLYSASSNLGDNLSLTPVMRAAKCRVHLIDDDAVRQVAPVFDGLCEVVYDNDRRLASHERPIRGPHSAKILAANGLTGVSAIPSINLTLDEVKWAHMFLSDFDLSKTCIVKASTSQINYRTPPAGLLDRIIAANPDVTFLTFGLSTKHVKHNFHQVKTERTYTIWDMPVRQMAAICSLVVRYIGPDTGDAHLMLSVGGKADVLVPPSQWHYDHDHFHYRPEDFVGEVPRTRYHDWTQPFGPSVTNINLTPNL